MSSYADTSGPRATSPVAVLVTSLDGSGRRPPWNHTYAEIARPSTTTPTGCEDGEGDIETMRAVTTKTGIEAMEECARRLEAGGQSEEL